MKRFAETKTAAKPGCQDRGGHEQQRQKLIKTRKKQTEKPAKIAKVGSNQVYTSTSVSLKDEAGHMASGGYWLRPWRDEEGRHARVEYQKHGRNISVEHSGIRGFHTIVKRVQ